MAKQPALLACLACREKHLKCDGLQPRCQRCNLSGSDCRWQASRRGYRGIKKRTSGTESAITSLSAIARQVTAGGSLATRRKEIEMPGWYAQPDGQDEAPAETTGLNFDFATLASTALQPVSGMEGKLLLAQDEEQQLLDLYYANFHAAHPILPPARALARLPPFPPSLDAVVKFIGAHFDVGASTNTRAIAARNALRINNEPESFYKAQALLLYAIALHARNAREDALEWLDLAIDAALRLGMNHKQFAALNGNADPTLEESLRRTWWELYIVDGMIAALHQKVDFRTATVHTDVGLPCDELVYLQSGYIPAPRTFAQMQNRIFIDDDDDGNGNGADSFSSFCYRIEAVQLLGRVMALGNDHGSGREDAVEGVDMALASWPYHLPPSKQEVLTPDGTVDEMLFQAYMVVSCAVIYFHLPRSHLMAAHAPNAGMSCAERLTLALPASTPHTHAVKTIEAANKLSSLASLQVPAERHTPFFICGLVLDAIVQLSACSIKACACLDVHRDGITLAIGVLKSLGQTWPISQTALQQVKAVARMVLEIGVHPVDRHIAQNGEQPVDIDSLVKDDVFLGDTPDLMNGEQVQLPI